MNKEYDSIVHKAQFNSSLLYSSFSRTFPGLKQTYVYSNKKGALESIFQKSGILTLQNI